MSNNTVFFKPRLTGKRFEDHAMPVELLSDFAALEELLIELAKQKYLEANPDRKRIPKGFTDGISLKLSGIEQGSVLPSFVLASAIATGGLFSGNDSALTYFEQAKQQFIEVVAASHNDNLSNAFFPTNYLSYFNRIGKNLMDDEAIDFNPSETTCKAILNKSSRRRIILSAGQNANYSDKIKINVQVSELDKSKQTFTIENGLIRITGITVPLEHKVTIYNLFTEYEKGCYAEIQGTALFNHSEKIINIENIEHMDVLDPMDVSVRLDQIALLEEGWYYGEGIKVDAESLKAFNIIFNANFEKELPLPATFPSIDGNIQMEWNSNVHDISLKINLADQTAELHHLNLVTDEEFEKTVNILSSEDWIFLNDFIKNTMS
ncbi:MAG: hypothetical protein RL679_836 [Bacteroidota bacterium]|jgi:hypothetical protein